MKPYHQIPIRECGESLVPIPLPQFAIELPHPYQKLGAPYGKISPYYLRQSVLEALIAAQTQLQQQSPGWRIEIFDAYRPIAVQQFMVDHTFSEVVRARNLNLSTLSDNQRDALWQEVYQLWALPSTNPMTPPPHSTGAAVDITLVNATGQTLDMGSAIDELSPRSHPDYYANQPEKPYHYYRQLLQAVMESVGFRRHPGEWWHFCLGDQMWAWLCHQENPTQTFTACYGRISLEDSERLAPSP
ncbi:MULTISPECIES: M15 family metallopeptidase [unclassified Coleofasciculus]|uniref:M15 family metallopeptidase n=1 Tax=unclassified Coleofasciculus TaxID=2692782 RepID=UPI00187FE661|nr:MULTISPECIES: M15 family metallopeptidase [unclassified Coleofasciculus]MBE9125316.1 D-alanyl-D-alanine dipeptidase [Coleofasciculus sp. LEGE 07081]MBE9148520.1 D-alanyl-D-alanine dipeptidase [Coleofasciculus sp. LEGE 07092]